MLNQRWKMKNKDDGRIGYLGEHMIASMCHPYETGYKLSLMDKNGNWLYSEYWDLNKGNTQAIPALKAVGWEVCNE